MSQNSINKNKIFLLGSSQVGVLNATFIQDYLSNHGQNFDVYDLGIDGDKPSSRLDEVDELISLHPRLVVYGIGLRDFEKGVILDDDSSMTTIQTGKTIDLLPSPQYMLQNFLSPVNQFLTLKLHIVNSPLVITQKILDHFLQIHQKSYDLYSKTPFIIHTYTNTVIRSQEDIKQDVAKPPSLAYNGVVSFNDKEVIALEKIIDKFQKNNIKIVIFTVPYPQVYLDNIEKTDLSNFNSIVQKLSTSHNVKIYEFQDKYAELDIWHDLLHVAVNKNAIIFSEDISKIILMENK